MENTTNEESVINIPERRSEGDRREVDRRQADRRKMTVPVPLDRRSGIDRREGERRSGADRRAG